MEATVGVLMLYISVNNSERVSLRETRKIQWLWPEDGEVLPAACPAAFHRSQLVYRASIAFRNPERVSLQHATTWRWLRLETLGHCQTTHTTATWTNRLSSVSSTNHSPRPFSLYIDYVTVETDNLG